MTHHITPEQIDQIAEQVGLVGPASRVGDCHAAAHRFARAVLALAAPAPQGEPQRQAWAPYLVDRADGVKGHYAIGRWNPWGYREVWNLHKHCWAAFSDDVMSLEEADSLLRQITIPTAHTAPAPAVQSEPIKPFFAVSIASRKWADLQEQGHRMQHVAFDGGPGGAGVIDPWGKVTWAAQPAVPSLQPACRYISEVLAGDAPSGEKHIARTIMHLLPLEQAVLGTPAQPKCLTCNGHGLIGGHMQDGSGYGEGCPDCNPGPAVPESADGAMPMQLGELAKRNIYDAIRGAYDLGYNDARNARSVPGDSAPGYEGRNVEADHGGALLNSLNQRLRNAPAQPAAPDDVARDAERYRWLREQEWFSGPLCVLRDPKRVLTRGIGLGADCPSGGRLDAAIDTARAAEKGGA